MDRPPEDLSLVELLPALQARTLSARELVQACLGRIEATEPDVRAFVACTPERALEAADRADADRAAGRGVGLLAGVPVAVKDLYLTAGTPTTAGSAVLVGHDPGTDSAAWERLAAAGAGLLGKTTTHEFAYGTASGPTRNPWDLQRSPGGSSGGSGAALAARMTPVALGTDTGGSLRIPAAACGVATVRAAHGRVSTHGVLPLAPSLDVAGPMARRLLDVSLLMTVLAGYDPRDPWSRAEDVPAYPTTAPGDLGGVRVGVPPLLWQDVDPQLVRPCEEALDLLVAHGAVLVEVPAPASSEEVLGGASPAYAVIDGAEALDVHHDLLQHRDRYTPQVLARVLEGVGITAAEYLRARRLCLVWAQQWRALTADLRLDALAHPTLTDPPPVVDPAAMAQGPSIRLCVPWSLAGFPAVGVPAGLDGRGLPVGLTLAGLPEREADLVGLGSVVDEHVQLWRTAPPDTQEQT